MKSLLADLTAFHNACDVPVLTTPQIPPLERQKLRWDLVDEEINSELKWALVDKDLVKIADAIGDGIYVLVGMALEYGIPLDEIWAEIQRSNMAKVDPATGKACKRPDGKVLKPKDWQPPNIAAIIYRSR